MCPNLAFISRLSVAFCSCQSPRVLLPCAKGHPRTACFWPSHILYLLCSPFYLPIPSPWRYLPSDEKFKLLFTMAARVFEPVCPTPVTRKLETVQSSPSPSLKRVEPTVYTVSFPSHPKTYRVRLGNPHACACQKKQPCIHVLAVLLHGFAMSPSNSLIWQQGLTELEMAGLISGSKADNVAQCRFCKEKITAPEGCADCACQFHYRCLVISAHARGLTPICPECHSVNFTTLSPPLCSACKNPLSSPFHKCVLCPNYTLCQRCHASKVHAQHPFRQHVVGATDTAPGTIENLQTLAHRELNPEDYSTLLELDQNNVKSVLTDAQYTALRHPLWGRQDSGETCPVCLTPFHFKERCVCLPCGHVFHDRCGKKWLTTCKDSCPVDNMKVTPC